METEMENILDLDRFPLDKPGSPERAELVAQCRIDLAERGMFNLKGLLRPAALDQCLKETAPVLEESSFTHKRRHNIYFKDTVDGLNPDHPALKKYETINHTICGDQIPDSIVCRIYEWPPFAQFLADTMEMPKLYTMDDPLAGANVMAYRDGEALNWHFDRSEFTTTLLLQAPGNGGEFEYRTGLRTDSDQNYDGIARFLNGEDGAYTTLPATPGTLNVFKGKNTLHRVSPVAGNRARIITVLSYYEQQGVRFSDEERLGFYGRIS